MATKGGDDPFLPCEIITNIFKRLPVKSILRFQSVCNDWKNLFKTQSFITQHMHHSDHKNPFLLLQEFNHNTKTPSLRLLKQNLDTLHFLTISFAQSKDWKIIGSCNGLLCVVNYLYNTTMSSYSLKLWNPAIREVKKIPQTRIDYLGLCVYGFGFSSIVSDYRIVKFYIQNMRNKKEKYRNFLLFGHLHDAVEVYSLSTGLWKELDFVALKGITVVKNTIASSDGMIVWVGLQDSIYVLISFDMVTEVFTIISIPDVGQHFRIGLGVCGDKFVVFWCNSESNSIEIRVMEQFPCESGNKSLICTESYRSDAFFHLRNALCVWRNLLVFSSIDDDDEGCDGNSGGGDDVDDDDEEEEEEEGEAEFSIKLFNLSDKKWEDFPNFSSPHDFVAGFSHVSSLVSVVSICNT